MKTTKKIIIIAVALIMMGATAQAWAAEGAAATFGVIDMNKVMRDTDAAKGIFSQLDSKRSEYQSQISKEEDALRSAEQEIVKKKDSFSKEEFEKKRTDFEGKVIQGQKLVQSRKRILDQAFNSSVNNLRKQAAKIVAEVAKEKNYSAVFTQDAVMMSTPDLDITDIVIERMNKQVKKIAVDWSASSEAAESAPKSGKK